MLLIAERAQVQDGKRFSKADGNSCSARMLPAGMPPKIQQSQGAVAPNCEGVIVSLIIENHIWPRSAADLCAALMLLLNSFNADGPNWQRVTRSSLAAVFSLVSAYFWIAGAMEEHALGKNVWLGLGLVCGLVTAYAVLAALILGLSIVTKDD